MRTKKAFKMKQKVFFISFERLEANQTNFFGGWDFDFKQSWNYSGFIAVVNYSIRDLCKKILYLQKNDQKWPKN